MKTYSSPIYGELNEPESFIELYNLLRTNSTDESINIRMWRGQSNIIWPIHSGAYRRLEASGKTDISERTVFNYEKQLLDLARHKGFGNENGRFLNDFELLAKLQHHGAATRLVDFSKNSLIALWFCVDSLPKSTGLLIGVHTEYIGGETEGNIRHDNLDYESFTKKLSGIHYPFFIEPPVVSPRISSQHGVFLYSAVTDGITGSLMLPDENDALDEEENVLLNANLFIAISPKLKQELRQILKETFDIRYATMFPDLDGFSLSNSWDKNVSDMQRW